MYPYVPASMAVDDPAHPDSTTLTWIQMFAAVRDQVSGAISRLSPKATAA